MLFYWEYSMKLTYVLAAVMLTACSAEDRSSFSFSQNLGFESIQSIDNSNPPSMPFPLRPDPDLSPGQLCDDPEEIRYPEGIAYCGRHVSTADKNRVIRTYDNELGFTIQDMDRDDFKIDHLIPLCLGGSNNDENLWPQHESLYEFTDILEFELCNRIARATITQAEAIDYIVRAKESNDEAESILEIVISAP